jgi:ketosteroid isomerase-like protein
MLRTSIVALGMSAAFGFVVMPASHATNLQGVPAQGGAAQAPAPLPSVDLPAELNRVLRDYETHWKAKDGPALSALFTDDGFIARGPWIRGRDAIRTTYSQTSGGDLRLRAVGYATSDTVGYIVGAFRYGESQNDNGKFILALRRAPRGEWKIAADLDASIRQ